MDLDYFTIEEKYKFWKGENIYCLISLAILNEWLRYFSILFPIYLAFPKWHKQKNIEFCTWITLHLSLSYNDSSFISLLLKIIANTFWNVLNYYFYCLILLLNAFIHLIPSEASIIYMNILKVRYIVNFFLNKKAIYLRLWARNAEYLCALGVFHFIFHISIKITKQ